MSAIDELSPENLQKLNLASLPPEDRARAKARLKVHHDMIRLAAAEKWQEDQQPKNMKEPFAATIPIVGDRPAAHNLTLIEDVIPGARPLMEGEVVAVDASWPVVKLALARKHLELTVDPITRPLVYSRAGLSEVTRPTAWARLTSSDPQLAASIEREIAPTVRLLNEQMAEVRKNRGARSKLELAAEAAEIAATVPEENVEILAPASIRDTSGVVPGDVKTSKRASR